MNQNTLRTVDTVTEEIVYCPSCNSLALRCTEMLGGGTFVECADCGFSWEENGNYIRVYHVLENTLNRVCRK